MFRIAPMGYKEYMNNFHCVGLLGLWELARKSNLQIMEKVGVG